MPEIPHTFGRVERSDERADASLQPFDRALRRLAQQCLQGMEHQLYWVELRRILRQVAQFCAASLDRLLHAGDFVERDVVDDHNVLTLERGDQTLLDVSQEGFSVHGSLDQHRRDDTSLTEASDKRHRFPVPHRHIPDQALSARVPTVETYHVGSDCSFVDKYKAGGVKQTLLADPASARPSHVGSLALCCPQTFFDSDAVASKEPGERAPASWDSPLVQSRNNLTQREVPLLTDEGENPLRVLLQWRSTPSTGYWLAGPVVAKALHPPDRGTDADVKLFGCFTSGSSSFHKANDSHSQLTRIRSMHWSTLRRINALDSLLRQTLGIPIHSGRDVL